MWEAASSGRASGDGHRRWSEIGTDENLPLRKEAGGEGGDACRIEFQERLKKRSRCGRTNVRCGSTAIPLTPQPLSPLGRGEPQSNLISIFSQLPSLGRGEPRSFNFFTLSGGRQALACGKMSPVWSATARRQKDVPQRLSGAYLLDRKDFRRGKTNA
jgi:hypothetical protein